MQKLKNLQVKGFIVGTLAMLLLLSGITVFAATRTETINVTFRGIRIIVDGVPTTPRDGAGNVVEPFIWEGTTYLPLRAIANALGQDVSWDGNTSTVYIGERPHASTPTPVPQRERQSLNDVSPFTNRSHTGNDRIWHSFSVVMDGTTYNNALNFRTNPWHQGRNAITKYSDHNLNEQFQVFSGEIGRVVGYAPNRALNVVGVTMNIIGDGKLLYSQEIFGADPPTPFSVNVRGVSQMKIQMVFPYVDSSEGQGRHYAIIGYLQ
jgi:hypothetical protein